MFPVVIGLLFGYFIAYGKEKLKEHFESKQDPSFISVTEDLELEEEPAPVLDFNSICDALDNKTGGEWYIEEDEYNFSIKAVHLDGGDDYTILSCSVVDKPRAFDSELIVNAINDYIPSLLNEIDRIDARNQAFIHLLESGLNNAKYTKEDYSNIIKRVLSAMKDEQEALEEE